MTGWQIRREAGFGKGGEKNFDGTMTSLENMLYVVISDFRQKKNKFGLDYGWEVSVYARPEEIWGEAFVNDSYRLSPSRAYDEICDWMEELYPGVSEQQLSAMIGKRI